MLIRGFLTLLCCLLASPAWAAVACGTETTASGSSDPTTLVATPDAGSKRVWIITVHTRDTNTDNTTVTVSSTGGGTFTSYGVNSDLDLGIDMFAQIFYSTDFVDGSQTLSADFSTTPQQALVSQYVCTGVNTASPWLGAVTKTTATATSESLAVPCVADGVAIDAVSVNGEDPTVGANQTEQYSQLVGGPNLGAGASYETGAATNTMSWSWSSSLIVGAVGGCLVPSVSRRPIPPIIFF